MRIFDTFMYNGEADILECRLHELYDVVDVFVIVEADRTHGGYKQKPYSFLHDSSRFIQWFDKIHYIMAKDMPNDVDPWVREHLQRDNILKGLHAAEEHDIIMISDVDEIPRAESVVDISPEGMTLFLMTLYAMSLDWYDSTPWWGTVAIPFGELVTPQWVRENRRYAPTKLSSAGWHLSWMGDDAARKKKFANGCHVADYAPDWNIDTGMFLGSQLREASYNCTYPKWITEGHAPAVWSKGNHE